MTPGTPTLLQFGHNLLTKSSNESGTIRYRIISLIYVYLCLVIKFVFIIFVVFASLALLASLFTLKYSVTPIRVPIVRRQPLFRLFTFH